VTCGLSAVVRGPHRTRPHIGWRWLSAADLLQAEPSRDPRPYRSQPRRSWRGHEVAMAPRLDDYQPACFVDCGDIAFPNLRTPRCLGYRGRPLTDGGAGRCPAALHARRRGAGALV
jgi:hypothetical protein